MKQYLLLYCLSFLGISIPSQAQDNNYNFDPKIEVKKQLTKDELARFTTMNPLSERYYSISPYA